MHPHNKKSMSQKIFQNALHAHVDGAHDEAQFLEMKRDLEKRGFPTKIKPVIDHVDGPQRGLPEFQQMYQHHTPGYDNREVFNHFSKTVLSERADIRYLVPFLIEKFRQEAGTVIEVEQVIGVCNKAGEWHWDNTEIPNIEPEEAGGHTSRPVLPIEIHHIFTLPPETNFPIQSFPTGMNKRGISLGGVFHFQGKDRKSAYGTNAFAQIENIQDRVQEENRIIRKYLESLGLPFELDTLAERVLGLYRT